LASIPLAWNGMGYWALVAGTLVGQLAQAIMLWRISPWRPKFNTNKVVTREIGKFGGWVGMTGLMGWFFIWVDSLVVGMYLGSLELGLYRTGNQLVVSLFALIMAPVLPVLYSKLVAQAGNERDLGIHYNKAVNIIIVISIILGTLIYVNSKPITSIFFNSEWKEIYLVIAYFGLIHGFAWVIGVNGEYYRAAGAPHKETIAVGISIPIYLSVYITFISSGLESFLISRFILVFVGIAGHLYLISTLMSVDKLRFFKNVISMAMVAFMSLIVTGMSSEILIGSPFVQIISNTIIVIALFLLINFIANKKELNFFANTISETWYKR
jgi:PST family polysaccharide transporter